MANPVRTSGVTLVMPAFNEAEAITEALVAVKALLSTLDRPSEVVVVDDGSSDQTSALSLAQGVRVIRHPKNSGYGRSLISGIESATYDTIAIMDADGTYPIEHLPDLLRFYDTGFHMVVGQRTGKHYHGTFLKSILRSIFRWLAEFTCGQSIPDINSGFRIFDRRPVMARKESLSTGFSFTTTITLMFMLTNHFVGYLPIRYDKRVGNSKVRLFRDSLRSTQIILTAIAQFNPLKLFLLVIFFYLAGNLFLFGASIIFGVLWTTLFVLIAMGWNTLCLLIGLTCLSLVLIKPLPRPERTESA